MTEQLRRLHVNLGGVLAPGEVVGRDDLTLLLERLEADHYLVRRGTRDHFPSNLVRRAWLAFRR